MKYIRKSSSFYSRFLLSKKKQNTTKESEHNDFQRILPVKFSNKLSQMHIGSYKEDLFVDFLCKNLKNKIEMLWSRGDWIQLSRISEHDLECSQYAGLCAIYVASAHLQLENNDKAKVFFDIAKRNGTTAQEIAQIVISSAEVNLAKSWIASGEITKAKNLLKDITKVPNNKQLNSICTASWLTHQIIDFSVTRNNGRDELINVFRDIYDFDRNKSYNENPFDRSKITDSDESPEHINKNKIIQDLVVGLPELYQPVYGYPEFSTSASQDSFDRLDNVIIFYKSLETFLKRPLNVLDIGCAQGFFSFQLAAIGANVQGIDFLDKNIELCNALLHQNPELKLNFLVSSIEEHVHSISELQYDLVIGFSVFHHIIHDKGTVFTQDLIEQLVKKCGVALFEFALKEEPLYWAPAQPENSQDLLRNIPFVHQIGRFPTHLSHIKRPMFIVSNRYWILSSIAGSFKTWSLDPHYFASGTHEGSRRYFFSQNEVIKSYQFNHSRGNHNKSELIRELQFFQNPPKGLRIPKVIAIELFGDEAWMVMERLPGTLLLDILRDKKNINHFEILSSILEQLVSLENVGLYHNDLRIWNVLIDGDDTAYLIDFGSITTESTDCVWPFNIYFSFFILVHELLTGEIEPPHIFRSMSMSPFGLPEPYRSWALTLWQYPIHDWSFRLFYELLLKTNSSSDLKIPVYPMEIWMKLIEESIKIEKLFLLNK